LLYQLSYGTISGADELSALLCFQPGAIKLKAAY